MHFNNCLITTFVMIANTNDTNFDDVSVDYETFIRESGHQLSDLVHR